MIERAVDVQKQQLIGWRRVPVDSEAIGGLARAVEPVIRQVFIGKGEGATDARAFARKRYIIRKLVERTVRESDLSPKS